MIYPCPHFYIVRHLDGKLDVIPAVQYWDDINEAMQQKQTLFYMVIDTADGPMDGYGYFVMQYINECNRTCFISTKALTKTAAKEYFIRVIPNAREGSRIIHDFTQKMNEMASLKEYLPKINRDNFVTDQLLDWHINGNPMKEKRQSIQQNQSE